MESIAFTPSAETRNEFKAQKIAPLLVMGCKNFEQLGTQLHLASNRKYFVLNSRNPKHLKVVQRITARHTDIADAVTDDYTSITFIPDQDTFVATSAAGEVLVVNITEAADQALAADTAVVKLPSAAMKAVAINSTTVVVVCKNGSLHKVSVNGTPAKMDFSTDAQAENGTLLSCSQRNQLVAVSGDGDSVQLFSTENWESALNRDWCPHGDEPTGAIQILDGPAAGGVTRIVTLNEVTNELRFWTVKGGSATLKQTLTIGGDKVSRKLVVDPNEEYIALFSHEDRSVLVLELLDANDSNFGIRRVTEWDATAPILCASLVVRKFSSSPQSGLKIELSILGRTAEKVTIYGLDADRLDGPPNVGELAEQPTESTNVLKWFGQKEATGGAEGNAGPAVQISSSSQRPSTQSQKESSERAREEAAAQVNKLSAEVRALLAQAKDAVEALQPVAHQNLTMLQDPNLATQADVAATNSAARIILPDTSSGPSPATREKIRSFYAQIAEQCRTAMGQVTTVSFEATLKKQIHNIAPQLSAGGVSAKDIPLPKLGSTDSMKAFITRLDRAHAVQNDVLKQEVNSVRQQCLDTVAATKKRAAAASQTSKVHLKNLQDTINEIKIDVAALAAATPKVAGGADAPVRDSAVIFEKCKNLARGGSWETAFAQLLEAANLSLVVQFLELDEVIANRQIITGPNTLSFPVVHALIQQLTHNIQSSPGLVALRVGWVHDILVGWDERFTALKDGSDADSEMFQRCSYDFMTMGNSLNVLGKNDVDPATRRQLTLVKRLLAGLA